MSGQYMAWVNAPGYLPMDDDPPTFDTAADAWDYLCEERMQAEEGAACDECPPEVSCKWSAHATFTKTVTELMLLAAQKNAAPGLVHGETPGYHGDHDLGLSYSVARLDK